MSVPALQRTSIFHWDGDTLFEDRMGGTLHVVPTQGLVVQRVRVSEFVRNGVGKVVRVLGGLLMLSPILIVPKLLVPSSSRWISDAATVFFVLLVVGFFAALNLYFVVSLIWWARRGPSGARFATADELRGMCVPTSSAMLGDRVKVQGVVVPLFPSESKAVLRRTNLQDVSLRFITEASPFAIVPAMGRPLIVSSLAIAVFEGDGREGDVSSTLSPTALTFARSEPLLRAECWELRAGQQVEIEAVVTGVVDNSDRFTLDGEHASLPHEGPDAPYRSGPGESALVVGSDTSIIVSNAR
jgi:hypothetical protein